MSEVWWKITEEIDMDMKKLLTMFLLLFSVNGYCEWTQVSTNEKGDSKLYLDFSTKKNVSGYTRIWVLLDSKRPDDKYKSFITLEEFDCSGERKKTLQLTPYSGSMGKGNSAGTLNENFNWTFVTPGTMEATMFRQVCN